jgi:hypothetical protein
MPCSSETARRFGGTYRIHLQARSGGNKLSWAQFSSCFVGFFIELFFGPEDGGHVFLRNVGLGPHGVTEQNATLFVRTAVEHEIQPSVFSSCLSFKIRKIIIYFCRTIRYFV